MAVFSKLLEEDLYEGDPDFSYWFIEKYHEHPTVVSRTEARIVQALWEAYSAGYSEGYKEGETTHG